MLSVLGLVLIGVGVAGLADLGPVRAGRPQRKGRLSGLRPTTAIVGGVGLIVVDFVLAVIVIVVLGGSSAGAQDEIQVVEVDVTPAIADEQIEPVLVDELEPEVLLAVDAASFPGNTTGSLTQCVDSTRRICRNTRPIRFDQLGRAQVQYLVRDRVEGADEACSAPTTRCTVELRVRRDLAVIETFFGGAAPPPGTIEVHPAGPHRIGDDVTVAATGFPPGSELIVTVCARPAVRGGRCGAPAPEAFVRVDVAGTAEVTLPLDVTRVGSAGVACGRRTECQVVVLADEVAVRARPVPLALSEQPGPSYDPARLIIAVLIAVGLLAAAGVLIASTDWDPPSEADSSAIDDAVYADLDDEADRFGEEPVPL
ncbi:MAG: hypothetical protein OES57_05650 [Acidimicrobiia bacterium]|nr:hypothetical protein [Acidimicrobiia bacterium]